MPVETEIKLRLPQGPERARVLLEQHGFQVTGPRQLETNQTFDLPAAELRQSGRLLRLRSTGGRWIVTYKGPAAAGDKHKSREEIEAERVRWRRFRADPGGSRLPAFVRL